MTLKEIEGGVCAAKGFKAAGVHSGIRRGSDKLDLALILSDCECSAAAVYTQNKVQGAPIAQTRRHIQNGKARGILCNSGNANTCAPGGEEIAEKSCALAAEHTGLKTEDFMVASTGVIGEALSITPFEQGIPQLAAALSAEKSGQAAEAIMTTDTVPKEIAYAFDSGDTTCHIGAIGKGSGMIAPNMATMLVFITTDAAIAPPLLQQALSEQVNGTFNQISVDGDTSTNDMVCILANGAAGGEEITSAAQPGYSAFYAALGEVCLNLCRAIAKDGEGATKLLQCHVEGAPSKETARLIAKSVISSDLFKTAMFGEDANWGRALCAIGYTPAAFSVEDVSLTLSSAAGDVTVCKQSAHHSFDEGKAAAVLAEAEINIGIHLHDGAAEGTAWGCDLSYDYVKINGDYRS